MTSNAEFDSALRTSLYRFDCPDALTLGEYQIGLLDPAAHTRVAGHAAECDACGSDLQLLRSYLAAPTAVPESLPERARRLVATLFLPAPGLAYAGLRGAAETTTRQYQVDDITVTVGPGEEPGTLVGLIVVPGSVPAAFAGCEVRLVPIEGATVRSTLTDIDNFEFEQVPAGRYALEVELPETLIVIEELRLG